MKKFTEKEQLLNQQHFSFRLRNLYYSNYTEFKNVIEFLPMFVQVNETKSRNIVLNNKSLFSSYKEADNLVKYGFNYLAKISCPFLYENLQKKHEILISKNDDSIICYYPQRVALNGNLSLILSNKMMVGSESYMVISSIAKDVFGFGKIYDEIFLELTKNTNSWIRFMSLTNKEQTILKYLASGYSNELISDKLFISKHTVITHRKNIYKKLDVDKVTQLFNFALALEIM